uniref:Uncharacterized protein n=1 Tax=Anopheles culicifacies TaxID=139723 RepID=A0A182MJ34_9DIPT
MLIFPHTWLWRGFDDIVQVNVIPDRKTDDEHSHVHGVLTSDNLFDGTVVTNLEQYYIEPAARYSPELERRHGVHTVIYKLSDVKIHQNHHGHHRPLRTDGQNSSRRAAEPDRPGAASGVRMLNLAKNQSSTSRIQFNLKPDEKKGRQSEPMDSSEADARQRRTGTAMRKTRRKRRWLEDEEVCQRGKVPTVRKNFNSCGALAVIQESRNPSLPLDLEVPYNNDYTIVRSHGKAPNVGSTVATTGSGGAPGALPPTRTTINRTVNRGIIGGTGIDAPTVRTTAPAVNNRKNHFLYNIYNPHGSGSTIITGGGMVSGIGGGAEQFPWTRTINMTGTNHNKDHYVEIITKNGSTRKNIPKMGSDEASIEAITRHVQRANLIYRKTGWCLCFCLGYIILL